MGRSLLWPLPPAVGLLGGLQQSGGRSALRPLRRAPTLMSESPEFANLSGQLSS